MVLVETNYSTNNTTAIKTSYSSSAVNNFDTFDAETTADSAQLFFSNLDINIFSFSDDLYNIIDLYFIKRYFSSSDVSYNEIPLYQQSFESATNEVMKTIFIDKTFSLYDFINEVYEETSNINNANYSIYNDIKTKLEKIVRKRNGVIEAVNVSTDTRQYITNNTTNNLPLYDFLLNEINYLVTRSELLITQFETDNPGLVFDFDIKVATGIERLYGLLNFLKLTPTLIGDKLSLQQQVDALNTKLNNVILNNITSTTAIMMRFEAETNIDYVYAVYTRVYGAPQNGVFDAAKIGQLRKATLNEINSLLDNDE